MKYFVILLLLVVCLQSQQLARYHLQTNSEEAVRVLRSESDFRIVKDKPYYEIDHIGPASDSEKLVQLGFKILNTTLSKPFQQIYSQDIPDGYTNPDELMRKFTALAANSSRIAKLLDLNKMYQTPPGWEGGRIYALKISSNVDIDDDKPNVLLVANHHCREIITPEIAYDVSSKLVNGYLNDSRIRKIVENNQIYIIWTMNPDGLRYVWEKDNMWRKNRRGDYGVDLNRNYPSGWNMSCSGSTYKYSEVYRGEYPASEPETQTMIAFQEDRKFVKVIDLHSYAEEVRPGYGECAEMPSPIRKLFDDYGDMIAEKMKYVRTVSCCMGGNIAWAYMKHGSLSVLVETGTDFQPPAHEMRETVRRVWPGILHFFEIPIPVSGHVTDTSKKPLRALITVKGIQFHYNEKFYSDEKRYGYFHLWLPEKGKFEVEFSAPGYDPVVKQVTFGDVVEVELRPKK